MNYRNPAGFALLLFTLLAFPASAAMVSFLVVETGLNDEAPSPQYSSLWEGGLMAVFFDSGHIVTNNPIARVQNMLPREISGSIFEADFDEAAEGGAEYFILGLLEYQNDRGGALPVRMIVRLYSTENRQLIFEQSFQAGGGRTLNDEYQSAQSAGRIIMSYIKERQ
jgi:hypothetical protein